MKKIDKAWEMNLAETVEEVKYKTKEELSSDSCPSRFELKDSKQCGTGSGDGSNCYGCWNEEIKEEVKNKLNKSDLPYIITDNLNCGFYPYGKTNIPIITPYISTNEDRFNTLRQSPINGICLNNIDVEQLKRYLKIKNEDGIIYFKQFNVNKDEQVSLQYDDIPKLIKWLQDIYDLTTKLKSEIEKEEKYTNFYLAREHMHEGGKCEYEGKVYYIVNSVMYLEFSGKEDKIENRVAYLSLEDIDSLEWLMLDK